MPEVLSPLSKSPALDSTLSRILIIDDEAGIRESLEILLTLEGYAVEMAVDGEEGLAILEHRSYDLVLLDLSLPGSRAWNFCLKSTSAIRRCPSS